MSENPEGPPQPPQPTKPTFEKSPAEWQRHRVEFWKGHGHEEKSARALTNQETIGAMKDRARADEKAKTQEAEKRSLTDPLTGLYNRRWLEGGPDTVGALEHEFNTAKRLGQALTVTVIDLDHFKDVNDTYGHAAGDAVLKEVAKRLRGEDEQGGEEDESRISMRSSDSVARLGGEEFVILSLSEQRADFSNIYGHSERILDSFRNKPFTLPDGRKIPVTASIGQAVYSHVEGKREEISTPEELLAAADVAAYGSKDRGRNVGMMWRPEMGFARPDRQADAPQVSPQE